jgi:hypothetical protein
MISFHQLPMPAAKSLNRVVDRVARRRSFSSDESDRAGSELVKFLYLCAESDLPLAPSEVIDDLWHEFILHTQEYAEFCQTTLGAFVHHVPSSTPDPSSYNRTLERINVRFGMVDERFWPSVGTNCDSDSGCGSKCQSCTDK